MELILFYFFSIILIFSAFNVFFSKNAVYSVFYLILCFCCGVGFLFLLEVEFMAMLFLIVYVGAVAVLFLFVVMILSIKDNFYIQMSFSFFYQYVPVCGFFFIVLCTEVFILFYKGFGSYSIFFGYEPNYVEYISFIDYFNTIEVFGQVLYTYYIFYFLVSGFILLVAIIGSISLTIQVKKSKGVFNKKQQQVYQQLSRNEKNAVFLLDRV